MEERDTRVNELLEAAKEIEEQLTDDGFSPEEVLFIATMLSHAASQLIKEAEGVDEDEDEDEGPGEGGEGAEEASFEPGEEPGEEPVEETDEDSPDYR